LARRQEAPTDPGDDRAAARDVVVCDHHVSMIERHEVTPQGTQTIDTVDGNVGLPLNNHYAADSVSGASYQLPQSNKDGMQIRAIWRPGIDAYCDSSQPASDAGPAIIRIL
jgi:hypothetical protein